MSSNNTQAKGLKNSKTQKEKYFEYLKTHVSTNSMASDETGIPQKNLTRYKRTYEKSGLLCQVAKKHCKTTGFMAWYLTTNPNFFPKKLQLELF